MKKTRGKVCFIVDSKYEIDNFIGCYINEVSRNQEVILISNDRSSKFNFQNVSYKIIKILRKPSLMQDIKSLARLIKIMRNENIECIYSINPKIGLLAALSGRLTRIPIRVHIFTGQVWAAKEGFGRFFYKSIDKLIAHLVSQVLADSKSQLDFLKKEGVVVANQGTVLGSGSVCGIDFKRFQADLNERVKTRDYLKVTKESVLLLFLGRITLDKGVLDLLDAFLLVQEKIGRTKDVQLLFVGPDEGCAQLIQDRIGQSECKKNITILPETENPGNFYNASDIFCLPSYREGFGMVVLEAACYKIPTVGSKIYGLSDSIVDGETGLLHIVKDPKDLSEKLEALILNDNYRKELGENSYSRVKSEFQQERFIQLFMENHKKIYKQSSLKNYV